MSSVHTSRPAPRESDERPAATLRAATPTGGDDLPGGRGARDLGTRPQGVRLRARRSPMIIALGILLACLGGLGGALLFQSAAERTSVLVMVHTVERGAVITAQDVTTTSIGTATGVVSLPASELSHVIGQRAALDLPAGSLPGPGSVGEPTIPPGDARVGLRVAVGRVPGGGLAPGTKVSILRTQEGADASVDAVVASAPVPTAAGDAVLLDVAVRPADAEMLARWAAADQVAVIRLAQ